MGQAEDKARGAGNEVVGKVKQAAGALTGDNSLKAEGEAQELKGEGQTALGKAKDAVGDALDAAGKAVKRAGS